MSKRVIHPSDRPEEYDIEAFESNMQELWQDAQADMQRIDSYYNRTNDIWDDLPPEIRINRPRFNSPHAPSIIDRAVSALIAYKPRFHRIPLGDDDADMAAASKIEYGLQSIFSGSAQDDIGYAPRTAAHNIIRYNYAITGVMLNPHAFSTAPKRRRGEGKADFELREWVWKANRHTNSPILIVAPSPTEVLMPPTRKTPQIALRKVKMTSMELSSITTTKAKKYGDTVVFDLAGCDPYEEHDVTEWWTPWWFAVMADGAYYAEPNQWGFQPFTHSFGEDIAIPIGETFNPSWFIKRAMLYTELDTIRMRDQSQVAHHRLLQMAAFPKLRYAGNPSEGAAQLSGDIVSGEEGEWGIIPTPELAAGSLQHLSGLDSMIERTTYSPSASGFPQSDVDTATNAIILSEATSRTFKAYVVQLEQLYSSVASNVLKLTERIEKIYTSPLSDIMGGPNTLNAKDINGVYQVTARFENVDAVLAMQAMQSAQRELKEGLIGTDQYYEKTNQEDPIRIRESIINDVVRNNPEIQQEWVLAAMRNLGYAKLADRLGQELRDAKLAEQAPPAPLPPEPMPGGGGMPQPPIPVGTAAIQAGGPLNGRDTSPF